MKKYFKKAISIILLLSISCYPVFAGVDFDKVDDVIIVGDIGVTGNWTISVWATLDTTTQTLYYPLGVSGSGKGLFMAYSSDKWGFYDGVSETFLGSVVSTGTLYHMVVTKSGTSYDLFLDGVDDYSGTKTLNDVDLDDINIGIRSDGFWPFDGIIAEVAIWSTVLSQDEITTLYNSGVKRIPLQVQPTSLELYLSLDDEEDGSSGDGDTFRDLSGNGNDGTGDDGANNTGLTAKAEAFLSYP